jgi:hypothetical protein
MKIKEAVNLIEDNQVKKLSERSWQVGEHHVYEQIRAGRSLILCDCYNHTEYATFRNEPSICKHKQAVIIFEYMNSKK